MTKMTLELSELTAEQAETNDFLHRLFPQHKATTILGNDDEGHGFAHETVGDRMWWRITVCCGASDKGTEDGVVCRSCYGPIGMEVSSPVVWAGREVDLFGGEPERYTAAMIKAAGW